MWVKFYYQQQNSPVLATIATYQQHTLGAYNNVTTVPTSPIQHPHQSTGNPTI